jgi:hypothetical protein
MSDKNVWMLLNQFFRSSPSLVAVACVPATFDMSVAIGVPAQFIQSFCKSSNELLRSWVGLLKADQNANPPYRLALLRARATGRTAAVQPSAAINFRRVTRRIVIGFPP